MKRLTTILAVLTILATMNVAAVFADTVGDNPAGSSIEGFGKNDYMKSNRGFIRYCYGEVESNENNAEINIVDGIVHNNYGKIGAVNGKVYNNFSRIGSTSAASKINVNEDSGTIENFMGGAVSTNNGNITIPMSYSSSGLNEYTVSVLENNGDIQLKYETLVGNINRGNIDSVCGKLKIKSNQGTINMLSRSSDHSVTGIYGPCVAFIDNNEGTLSVQNDNTAYIKKNTGEIEVGYTGKAYFLYSFDNDLGATITELSGFAEESGSKWISDGARFRIENEGDFFDVTADNANIINQNGTYTISDIKDTTIIHINDHKDHVLGEWTTSKDPTCTEKGVRVKKCAVCDYTETEDIPASGHVFSDWTTTKEPSCAVAGTSERTCYVCGYKNKKSIPAHGHEYYDAEWKIEKYATISNTGLKYRCCDLCGAKQKKSTAKIKPFASFKKATYSVYVKKNLSMKSCLKMARGDSVKKWSVSKKGIATISKAGKLTAKKTGKVKVNVVLKSGKKASCTVKITKPKAVKVYWTPGGSVYHKSRNCATLSRSKSIKSGTIKQSKKKRCCKVCGG